VQCARAAALTWPAVYYFVTEESAVIRPEPIVTCVFPETVIDLGFNGEGDGTKDLCSSSDSYSCCFDDAACRHQCSRSDG